MECFFGNLKQRFRLLKSPILYREKEKIDNIFFTCCILHNMLHSWDQMHDLPGDSHSTGPAGLGSLVGCNEHFSASALPHVRTGRAQEVEEEEGFSALRDALIVHFEQRRMRGEVRWLRS